MMIDGRLYPLHLAISSEWLVHYVRADNARSPAHQAEESAFLDDPWSMLGTATTTVLHRIVGAVGLDFGGVDFAVDIQERVVVFEANAGTALYAPGPVGVATYRWAARKDIEVA
ncbi:MAG: hypothetical protein JO247_11180 [Chloroflexi bacterium]|nr:hypothetical protein [Chloroflexota bacterium]